MSLDVTLFAIKRVSVFDYNITHNLNTMAARAGIYRYLWRPEEMRIERAGELIEPLEDGLYRLKSLPEHFKKYNPSNGWGNYEALVMFVEDYLRACREHPEAEIHTSR